MSNSIRRHMFTEQIEAILKKHFGEYSSEILSQSPQLGYLNEKTKAASRGAKSRGSFGNHYALYVLVEDYIQSGFAPNGGRHGNYESYDGARFSDLFRRQRELPFGAKLQNHALNDRLNGEFRKFYPTVGKEPIVRDVPSQRYWVQEDLLKVTLRNKQGSMEDFNIAHAIIEIIDTYVAAKREAFEGFIETCRQIAAIEQGDGNEAIGFVQSQLRPEVDARVFEIVSFAILKAFYGEQQVFWGWS